MPPSPTADTLADLRDALERLGAGARELDRLCRRAADLLDRGATERGRGAGRAGASEAASPSLAPRGGTELPLRETALLVGVTARGGTVDGPELNLISARLGLAHPALEPLFVGPAPHLVRRDGGMVGVTERGVEAAARWRDDLPEEMLRAATDA